MVLPLAVTLTYGVLVPHPVPKTSTVSNQLVAMPSLPAKRFEKVTEGITKARPVLVWRKPVALAYLTSVAPELKVGSEEGAALGCGEGDEVGTIEGTGEGRGLGDTDGRTDGGVEGLGVGNEVGRNDAA